MASWVGLLLQLVYKIELALSHEFRNASRIAAISHMM